METLPQEIKRHEFYKHLSYDDLINLCYTNQEFSYLCYDNNVWQFMLKRDFGILTNVNAKQTYLLYKHALDFLSNYYEVITLDGLIAFVRYMEPQHWHLLDDALVNTQPVFSIDELVVLIQYVINGLTDEEIQESSHPFVIEGNIFTLNENIINTIRIYDDNLINKIILEGCDKLLKYSKIPSYVFYHKQLKMVSYNYDIAYDMEFNVAILSNYQVRCKHQLNDIIYNIVQETQR
jgi:hypothetical protein